MKQASTNYPPRFEDLRRWPVTITATPPTTAKSTLALNLGPDEACQQFFEPGKRLPRRWLVFHGCVFGRTDAFPRAATAPAGESKAALPGVGPEMMENRPADPCVSCYRRHLPRSNFPDPLLGFGSVGRPKPASRVFQGRQACLAAVPADTHPTCIHCRTTRRSPACPKSHRGCGSIGSTTGWS